MNTGTVCYTSFTWTYLSRAQVLAATLRAVHPDWTLAAVLVDRAPTGIDPDALWRSFDSVLLVDELDIPDWRRWLFGHDVVEACTAVKGAMMQRLIAEGFDKIVYLDPDIAVFHPLAAIEQALDEASILLTPHQVAANDSSMAFGDNELGSMRHGVYNLGFIAVRADPVGRDFAAWWARQLYRACYDDVPNGIFTDQKYCDLVPALFDRVRILRDPGCNVATWNLSRRRIEIGHDGDIRVNGSPLKFFHFTKIGGEGDVMAERYGGDNVAVFEIWNWYRRLVEAGHPPTLPHRYWHYGRFSNGAPISRAVRRHFRAAPDIAEHFSDPFDAAPGGLYDWLSRERPELLEQAG